MNSIKEAEHLSLSVTVFRLFSWCEDIRRKWAGKNL